MSGERRRSWRRRRGRAPTSMEPRSYVRGEGSCRGCTLDSDKHGLRWSPRTCVQGEVIEVRRDEDAGAASMEARTCVQGEDESRSGSCSRTSLDGTPDLCPGRGRGERPPARRHRPASMEPRTCVQGEGQAPHARRLRRRRFNGAPDLCPGRGPSAPRPRLAASSFNGAPDLCPGRGRARRGQHRLSDPASMEPGPVSRERHRVAPLGMPASPASMEPRTCVQGEVSSSEIRATVSASLRWSPGPVSRERRQRGRNVAVLATRFDEPGPCVQGEGAQAWTERDETASASIEPGPCPGRGRHRAGVVGLRGAAWMEPRTCVQGEVDRRPRASLRRAASMEPRTCVQGEGHVPDWGASSPRLNGAPDLCPGRGGDCVIESDNAIGWDWSPGPVSRTVCLGPATPTGEHAGLESSPGPVSRERTVRGAGSALAGAAQWSPRTCVQGEVERSLV